MTDEPEIVRTSLRLPKKLYDRLAEASEGKTMHAEIIHRLEGSFRSPLSILKREVTVRANGPGFEQTLRLISPDKKPTREELIAMAADEMRAVTAELDYLLSLIEAPTPD